MRLTTVFEHPRGATCHRRSRANNPIRAEDAKPDIRDAIRSTAASIISSFPAHQFREHAHRIAALGQNMAVAAMGRSRDIVGFESR